MKPERPPLVGKQDKIRYLNRIQRKISSYIGGRNFTRNMLTLSVGTVLGQAIGILSSPITSRIYSPEDFGLFGTFAAIAIILASVTTLKYEWAIVLAESDEEATALYRLCINLAVASAVLTLIAVGIWFFVIKGMPVIYWVLPISLLVGSLFETSTYWANRQARYKIITQSRVIVSLAGALFRIGLGLAAFGSNGLALADFVSKSMGVVNIYGKTKNVPRQKGSIAAVFQKYNRFWKYSSPAAFLNAASYNFEYILFVALFTVPQIGAYYFWNRIIGMPKQFIAGSIWQVFLQDSALLTKQEIGRRKKLRQQELISLTAMPYYSAMIALPGLLIFIFGERWAPYTNLISPILIGGHVNLVVSSFSLFVILEENKAEFTFNLALIVSKMGSVFIVYWITHSFVATVWVIAITQTILFMYLGEWNYSKLGLDKLTFVNLYLRKGIIPILPFLALIILTYYLIDNIAIRLVSFLMTNGFYYMFYSRNKLARVLQK